MAKKKKKERKKRYEINHAISMIVHTKKLKKNLEDEVKEYPKKNKIQLMNERLTRDYEQNPIQPNPDKR